MVFYSFLDYFVFVAGAHTIVTTDQAVRGGKVIQLKKTVDEAVSKCPDIVKRVFVAKRTGAEVPMGEKDFCLEKVCFIDNTYMYTSLGMCLEKVSFVENNLHNSRFVFSVNIQLIYIIYIYI